MLPLKNFSPMCDFSFVLSVLTEEVLRNCAGTGYLVYGIGSSTGTGKTAQIVLHL